MITEHKHMLIKMKAYCWLADKDIGNGKWTMTIMDKRGCGPKSYLYRQTQRTDLKWQKIQIRSSFRMEKTSLYKVYQNQFFTFSSYEKVLVLCEKWLSKFPSNIYVLIPPEWEKTVFTKVFVCLSVVGRVRHNPR